MLKLVLRASSLFFILCLILVLPKELSAQNSREIESRRVPAQLTKDPAPKKKISRRKAKKLLEKTYSAYFDRLIVEYEDRMEANVKRNSKLAKELQKPQFSDPSYFGHKKPPKKRKRNKKRKCKECHMWH